jgi:hypothetical protein
VPLTILSPPPPRGEMKWPLFHLKLVRVRKRRIVSRNDGEPFFLFLVRRLNFYETVGTGSHVTSPNPGSFSPSRRERKRAWERGWSPCYTSKNTRDVLLLFYGTLVTPSRRIYQWSSELICLRCLGILIFYASFICNLYSVIFIVRVLTYNPQVATHGGFGLRIDWVAIESTPTMWHHPLRDRSGKSRIGYLSSGMCSIDYRERTVQHLIRSW